MGDGTAEQPPIDPETLSIQPFTDNKDAHDFDCGNASLNEFLCSDEVKRYQARNFGATHLVYCENKLVAYFTVCTDSLRREYIKNTRWSKDEIIAQTPALKIGRLAVDKRCQGRGIGTALLQYIVGLAMEIRSSHVAVRLIILQAKPGSMKWYLKRGFQFTNEVRKERRQDGTRTMFADLDVLAAIAEEEPDQTKLFQFPEESESVDTGSYD